MKPEDKSICIDCRKPFAECTCYEASRRQIEKLKTPALLPCPFCSSNAHVDVTGYNCNRYYVACDKCHVATLSCLSERGAINRWNKRSGK